MNKNKTYSLNSFILILIHRLLPRTLNIGHPIEIANINMLNKFDTLKYISNIINPSFLHP